MLYRLVQAFESVESVSSHPIYYLFLRLFSQGGKKLERARDLFEQVLEGCPAKFAKCRIIIFAFLPFLRCCSLFKTETLSTL